jgi:nitrite reductase/ring-hydroxylating ferredoxin subunit
MTPEMAAPMLIDARTLPLNEVRAVSEDTCVVRTAAGVVAFERTCPHAGADLAASGYVSGGKLRCSWHNLPYDLNSGRQPCASLPDLKLFSLREVDADVYELDADT